MYLVNPLTRYAAEGLFVAASRFRMGQALTGTKDGANATFTVPSGEKFTHNLPFFAILVYYNGLRLTLLDDYTIVESGGLGTGYDTVVLEVAPVAADHLTADYIVVATM